jgi:5'(3')-deoxyribonucleotidase
MTKTSSKFMKKSKEGFFISVEEETMLLRNYQSALIVQYASEQTTNDNRFVRQKIWNEIGQIDNHFDTIISSM